MSFILFFFTFFSSIDNIFSFLLVHALD